MLLTLGVQALLSLTLPDAAPARFGVPLPADALDHGLRLPDDGGGRLQWRRLSPGADPQTGRVWVELAISGRRGRIQIAADTTGRPNTGAPACAVACEATDLEESRREVTTWRWTTGECDSRTRTLFRAEAVFDGELYADGEALTVLSPDWLSRALRVQLPRELWTTAAVLPRDRGQARTLRTRLVAAAKAMRELPGARGAGDFGRSNGEVTNLEFDTALGLLRLGLCEGDAALLALGYRCARHTLDRDMDPRSGMPFPHGPTHRSGRPEPGHVWLQGMLLAGCLFADDELLAGAGSIAHGLAHEPPMGEGAGERARDYAWPLLELESWLAFAPDPECVAAADHLAAAISQRFDAHARTFAFGEGRVGKGVYFERAWITGGIVLPALRAHLRRRPDDRLANQVATVAAALLQQLGNGKPGIPTHWRVVGSDTVAAHRAHDDPFAAMFLEGFAADELQRLLRKDGLWRALGEIPGLKDPDLATAFSQVARCSWVYR
jgi:hypothetical protein